MNQALQGMLDSAPWQQEDFDWESFWDRYLKMWNRQIEKEDRLAFEDWRKQSITDFLKANPGWKHNGRHYHQ